MKKILRFILTLHRLFSHSNAYNSDDIGIKVRKSSIFTCYRKMNQHIETNGFSVQSPNIGNTLTGETLAVNVMNSSSCLRLLHEYLLDGDVFAQDLKKTYIIEVPALGLLVPSISVHSRCVDG